MPHWKTRVVLCAALGALAGCSKKSTPPPADAGIWSVQAPFAAPSDRLAGTNLVACPVLNASRCTAGKLQQCVITDTASGTAAANPDPLLTRVLTFERWYDLYHSPDGQTAERWLNQTFDAGTPETQWGSPAAFARYSGLADTAIWSGVSLNAYLMRYLVTGSTPDYQRVENKVRTLVTLFDVTGIPGYLARYHFIRLPGAPPIDKHITDYQVGDTDPPTAQYHAIANPASVPGLPPDYLTGVTDADGGTWTGTPMWCGFPSIDQYSGLTVSLPAAYSLIKDTALQQKIAYHLTCYLKRLQRLEIHHVQSSPDAVNLMKSLLGADSSLTTLDTLVVYYLPQYNSKSAATFDMTCPASITLTAGRVLDATSTTFENDVFNLVADLSSGVGSERATGIDHYYVPNLRGADAIHLMNLAAMGYYFTGDPQYQQFMDNELIANLHAPDVAPTLNVGKPNKWCRKFYDSHISVPPLWAFTNLLAPSPLRSQMESVLWTDGWLGDGLPLDNAKLGLMAASHAPAGSDAGSAVSMAMRELNHLGGNGGVLLDPRRTYTLPYESLIDAGVVPECPTEAERTSCESGPTIFGIQLQGAKITSACTGAPNECAMDGGVCAPAMAAAALPIELRVWEDFEWQRNPYTMGVSYSPQAQDQSPGLDLTEEYWLARYYGLTTSGAGQTLTWQTTTTTCP